MNKKFLFSAVALTACAFADGDSTNSSAMLGDESLVAGRMDNDCNPKPKECKPKPKPCEPCIKKGMQPIVLTSSRPCNDAGVYFFVDALYWHADVDNSDYAFVDTNFPDTNISGHNKQYDFKWNWGFRVGLGFDLDHDQWDTDFYYTWFVNKTKESNFNVGGGDATVLTANFPNQGTITSGSSHAKLNYNVLDWELGRWFYVSNSISLRPHAGLKAAWIKLEEHETFKSSTNFASYEVENENKSWAIGPSAGINSNWYFGTGNTMDMREGHRGEVRNRPHWSIFGDAAAALMYSHFSNHHKEHSSPAGFGFNPNGLNRNRMVPVLSGILGLAYDTCFDCDKMHFGIRIGYELQYWFRQSQRMYITDLGVPPQYQRPAEALALQGMTIDVRFDF